jgi:hypothetical protein
MEFIASLDMASQLCAFKIFFGFWDPKAALKDRLFMQVMAAQVSNSQDIIWFLVLKFILGQIFSPGVKILKSLL